MAGERKYSSKFSVQKCLDCRVAVRWLLLYFLFSGHCSWRWKRRERERERVEETLAVQLRMRRWMHVAITWSFNSSENDFKAGAEPPTVLNDLNWSKLTFLHGRWPCSRMVFRCMCPTDWQKQFTRGFFLSIARAKDTAWGCCQASQTVYTLPRQGSLWNWSLGHQCRFRPQARHLGVTTARAVQPRVFWPCYDSLRLGPFMGNLCEFRTWAHTKSASEVGPEGGVLLVTVVFARLWLSILLACSCLDPS